MPVDVAVVPVAGRGTRLLPATKSQPKEMLPVGRKPVVQYVVEELAMSGIRRMLFVTGPGKASIENHFDLDNELITHLRESGKEEHLKDLEFQWLPIQYGYTRQRQQLGLGHAVLCAEPLVRDQPFVVALGDSIIGLHAQSDIVRRMVDEFDRSGASVVVAFEEVPPEEVVHYGVARPQGEAADGEAADVFELAGVVEKPSIEQAPSNLAVAARYVFSPAIFEKLASTQPGKGGEIQLTDAMQALLDDGHRGIGLKLPADQQRYDIGNFDSYFRAFVDFALADPNCGAALRDHVREKL